MKGKREGKKERRRRREKRTSGFCRKEKKR